VIEQGSWFNLNSPNEYLALHRTIATRRWRADYLWPNDWPIRIGPEAIVDSSAEILGTCSIGAKCRIDANVVINDSIIWPGAQIASCSRLERCIVRSQRRVEGVLTDAIV